MREAALRLTPPKKLLFRTERDQAGVSKPKASSKIDSTQPNSHPSFLSVQSLRHIIDISNNSISTHMPQFFSHHLFAFLKFSLS